jgi:hypothetical protein
MRSRSRVLVVTCLVLSSLVAVTLLSASATAQSQVAADRVIVVFKNQDPAQPATRAMLQQRKSSFQNTQAPVVSQLSSSGARSIHSYTVLDAVSATVSPDEVSQLKASSAVSEVIPDQVIQLAPPQAGGLGSGSSGASPLPGACAPKGQVQLDPEALEAMSVDSQNGQGKTARSLGITGAGVSVAYIADGLDINNPDFIRANGQHVFSDYKDFTGLGTSAPTGGEEAFEDASSIAAQGREVYDVSQYSDLPLKRACDIRVEGVAPGASLVGLVAFGSDEGFNSAILEAIDYAVSVDHVNVLNESFGDNVYPDDQASLDLIKQADDAAVQAGTTVAVSTGDAGVTSTIGSPASDPLVISAGASTTYRLDAQDGYGGARFPGVTGWLSNNISSFSSGGFQQNGGTIDAVAPGELNWGLCSTNTTIYSECTDLAGKASPVVAIGGTSESSPLTAGVAALVIQAYRNTHNGSTPSPALVKQLIVSNTDDIGAPADQQGAGLEDAYKAVLAAESYNGTHATSSPTGVFVDSATQLNAVDSPGTAESLTDTLTNESSHRENVSLSTRAIGTYSQLKTATVTLSDTASPHITDWQGINDNYESVKFNVPYGENRLSASIAYQNVSASDLGARVRMTLIDPTGKLASYNVPQGDGNFGNGQVADPAAGTWTAYIYSRDSADGGTTGPVIFGASAARYTSFGQVSPASVLLAPGQSAAVTLHVTTPSIPGDGSGAIVIASTRGGAAQTATTTIPVTLRSLIPSGNSSFTDTLTGGNGRGVSTGQEFYYQLNVPAGSPELNATVTLANNANNDFGAWLVNPAGEAVAYSTNTVLSSTSSSGLANEIGAQLHTLSPPSGTWTVIVAFAPQVSGVALSEPFTVATNQHAIAANAGGVPDSTSTKLKAGTASTYNVTIKNTGTAQESFFPDARLPGSTSLNLGALGGATTTEPLTGEANIPEYLVPTNSTTLSEQASTTGSQPIIFDSASPAGDPDIASTFGQTAAASFAASPISQGPWTILPIEYGAFGASGGPTETVTTSASVTTSPFDPTVSSPTGDLEADSANPATSLGSFDPVTVGPGQTATIPVTITPAGASGTQVSGTLYIDDNSNVLFANFLDPIGDQVAAIPYSYTVR